MVADLTPACSPSSWASIVTSYPCALAQREYIRSSMPAQSFDSVPPAPELTSR